VCIACPVKDSKDQKNANSADGHDELHKNTKEPATPSLHHVHYFCGSTRAPGKTRREASSPHAAGTSKGFNPERTSAAMGNAGASWTLWKSCGNRRSTKLLTGQAAVSADSIYEHRCQFCSQDQLAYLEPRKLDVLSHQP
jgi:hypothetical protein